MWREPRDNSTWMRPETLFRRLRVDTTFDGVTAECHVGLQRTFEDAKQQIATAVKDIQDRDKNKSKTPAAGAAKPEEKKDKQAASGELLPLWCKPPASSATVAGGTSAAPAAEAGAPAAGHVEVRS